MTYTDPYPDERATALISQVEVLDNDDDAWTWLDNDPDVAWEVTDEPTHFGSLRDILLEAGWDRCYHNERARFHYNVKVSGMKVYRAFADAIGDLHPDAQERVRDRANSIQDGDLEDFWGFELQDFLTELEHPEGATSWFTHDYHKNTFGCGRSGGYLNSSKMESNGADMIRLAQFLERTKHYYNSAQYGKDLAERAIEEDHQQQMADLASPRIERIEA